MNPISFMRLRHLSKPEDALMKCDPKQLAVEQKYDGFKILATRDYRGTRLYSRNGNDLTAKAPEIVARLDKLLEPGDSVLGEMVYFIGKKQSLGSVQGILHSASVSRAKRQTKELGGKLQFVAYDMLTVGGREIHQKPLSIRRAELDARIPARGFVKRTKIYKWAQRDKAIKEALSTGGEGIVIKDVNAPYQFREVGQPEPWGSWWKYKVVGEKANTEDVILDGYAKREKRLAFKMYQYDPSRKKVFVGYISNLPRETEKEVARLNDRGKAVVAEVSHQERFPSGKFRHPGWIRLRPDKPVRSATMTKLSANPRRRVMPTKKPYHVYVAADEGPQVRLYTFSSKDYVQPHASAFQHTMAEIQKGGEGDVWIISSDADLKKFLRRHSNARLVRGKIRKANPRNSKVKDALAAEAIQHKNFEDFSKMYWDACSRGLYWYATDEKRFNIGLAEEQLIKQGKFHVYCSPTLALRGKNEGKKFVAELDLSKLNPQYIKIKRESDGAEISITGGSDFVKVSRVLDADKAKRAFQWQLSILPSSKEELRLFWGNAWDKHKKKVARLAVQRRKKQEREADRALRLAQKEREAEEREIAKVEAAAEKAKRARIARGKSAQKIKGKRARAAAERRTAEEARATKRQSTTKSKKKASKKAAKRPSKKTVTKKAPKKTAEKDLPTEIFGETVFEVSPKGTVKAKKVPRGQAKKTATKKQAKKSAKKKAKKKAAKKTPKKTTKKKVVRRTRVPGPGVTGVTTNPGTRKVPANYNRPASK